jgi:hypothetical protein
MKRYIILFNNGQIVQQVGLNLTYLQLHDVGVIKLIIDTKKGLIMTADKWEWHDIPVYHDSSLMEEIK